MANVTPRAIIYKGQIVYFSNAELQLITLKAATSGITPYKAAREVAASPARKYAAGQGLVDKPTQAKISQPKPATVQLIGTGQQGKLLQDDSHGGQIQTQDGAVRWYHISEYTYHLD